MALDGPYHDETSDRRPERQLRSCSADAEPAKTPAEPAEPRTRTEYYEALRTAEKEAAQADERPRDAHVERSGWDSIDAENRPTSDAIHISPDRSAHILDGDDYGGGHRHGTGKPGKTEFPANWEDKKVVATALDIARKPDRPPVHQDWNNRWLCVGTRHGVEVSVIVLPGGDVWTAWPEEGSPGVVRNPRKGKS